MKRIADSHWRAQASVFINAGVFIYKNPKRINRLGFYMVAAVGFEPTTNRV